MLDFVDVSAVWAFCFAAVLAQAVPPVANPCGACSYPQGGYYGGWWTTPDYATTSSIEAVTLVVVTGGDGTTSTSTILNFPPGVVVPPTNAAGYPVHAKTLTYGSSIVTTTLTWPTGFVSYQTGALWSGTIPVAASSGFQNSTNEACSTAPTGAFSTFPSAISPLFPTPTPWSASPPAPVAAGLGNWWDWSFFEDGQPDANCFGIYNRSVFAPYSALLPDFPVYEYCSAPMERVCAALALQSVAFLTVTSHTSLESGQSLPTSSPQASPTPAQSQVTRSATAAPITPVQTIRGPLTTSTIHQTAIAASDSQQITSKAQLTSTSTVVEKPHDDNPHDSRSIIRTSPFAVTASSHRGASSHAAVPLALPWAVLAVWTVLHHSLG